MPASPDIAAVAEHFRRAIAAGRMPHALIVSGRPRGGGLAAAEAILHLLYDAPDAPADLYKNVDIRWVEPESKSRQIRAEDARALIDFLSLTSYEGGWKACVILFADRLNPDAQNILLKTLEEPPPNSLLILVTATPSALLATVRSRAQTVDVAETEDLTAKPWYPHVLDLLRNPPARRPPTCSKTASAPKKSSAPPPPPKPKSRPRPPPRARAARRPPAPPPPTTCPRSRRTPSKPASPPA